MKKHLFFSRTCIALFSIILIASCQKKIEPVSANFAAAIEMNSSLLADSILQGVYVSSSDTAAATYNLYLYSKAGSMQQTVMNSYNTGAKDGNGVAYNKKKDEIYQVGRSQKIIYTFSNASTTPTLKQTVTDASLSSGREIAYDETRDILYVANNTDSTIRRYQSFSALNGEVTGEVLKITGQPWGIAYEPTTDRLVVLIDQTAMRLDIFDAPSVLAAGSITANRSVNVTDRPNNVKSRLHGLSIDMKNNLLIVTEIGEAAAPVIVDTTKPAFNADGGIYVFRKAQTLLSSGGTVAADALIYGSNTGLGNPVDVQVRDINGKTYILVCEKANKKILVFHVNANGNAFPASTTVTTYAPEDMCTKQ